MAVNDFKRKQAKVKNLVEKLGAIRLVREKICTIRGEGEEGSISILVFGLFLLALSLVFLLTDLASMIVAQRSLVSASENAAIQATHILDRAAYYRGDTGVSVPLDCNAALGVVSRELSLWEQEGSTIRRPELSDIELVSFYCFGDLVEISTSAQFKLPFVLPGSSFSKYKLSSKVGARSRTIR